MLQRLFLLIVLCLPLTSMAAGKVYTWTDESGTVHYADRPPADIEAEEIEFQGKKKAPVSVNEGTLAGQWYGRSDKGSEVKLTFNENGTITYTQTKSDQSVFNYQGLWSLEGSSISVITEFSQTAPANGDFKRSPEPMQYVYNVLAFGNNSMEYIIESERFTVSRIDFSQ
ncbi:DUF4124 domain-containing protein [Reinekea marinisedimentorum]|uniref:Uncharacterized protein DUF4124 n=1 Tax=Reinekea marinisedimentorum TaxID=230495 RepID=A0A4R3IAN0_9GAMM|nr:DUF4124 domain-containing protein [Reinekea marinisedimentorum]TCS43034.1 uncharacterized protein DUF4124 [Reinekea marinisedimentorum]